MSFKAFVWAWDQELPKDDYLIVLLALADIADEAGRLHASAGYIAGRCRRHERSVRRALQGMAEAGLLTLTERPGKSDVIRLAIPREFMVKTVDYEAELEAGLRGRPRRKTPDTVTENPGHGVQKPPHSMSGEPIEEPKEEPKSRATALVVVADDVRQAFDAFNALVAEIEPAKPAKTLNDDRRRRLKARLKECGGLDRWCELLATIPQSPFLSGSTHHRFSITLDFLLQPSSFTKLMEGHYHDTNRSQTDGQPAGHARPTDYASARNEARLAANFEGAGLAIAAVRKRRWV